MKPTSPRKSYKSLKDIYVDYPEIKILLDYLKEIGVVEYNQNTKCEDGDLLLSNGVKYLSQVIDRTHDFEKKTLTDRFKSDSNIRKYKNCVIQYDYAFSSIHSNLPSYVIQLNVIQIGVFQLYLILQLHENVQFSKLLEIEERTNFTCGEYNDLENTITITHSPPIRSYYPLTHYLMLSYRKLYKYRVFSEYLNIDYQKTRRLLAYSINHELYFSQVAKVYPIVNEVYPHNTFDCLVYTDNVSDVNRFKQTHIQTFPLPIDPQFARKIQLQQPENITKFYKQSMQLSEFQFDKNVWYKSNFKLKDYTRLTLSQFQFIILQILFLIQFNTEFHLNEYNITVYAYPELFYEGETPQLAYYTGTFLMEPDPEIQRRQLITDRLFYKLEIDEKTVKPDNRCYSYQQWIRQVLYEYLGDQPDDIIIKHMMQFKDKQYQQFNLDMIHGI